MPIAYRIETPRLVLRCFVPEDAALRKEAVDASLAHLGAFSARGQTGPIPVAEHLARVRRLRGMFDLDQDYCYALLDAREGRFLGELGLLVRAGPCARELGYWIRAGEVRQGFATEAAGALVRVAFELLDVERVDLRCGPENAASAGVATKLGFVLEGTLRHRRIRPEDEPRDDLSFSLVRSELAASHAASIDVRAFDVAGAPIPMAPPASTR